MEWLGWLKGEWFGLLQTVGIVTGFLFTAHTVRQDTKERRIENMLTITTAHRELEALTLDREVMHYKQHVALKYAELVYFGLWFTPLREALDAFVDTTQQNLTGAVTLSLYKGNVNVVSRKSDYSLYRTDLSSFTMGASYDQKDAEGFIRILGLPSRCRAQTKNKVEVAS